ncbi:MAG: mechanosensitive ion channel family protein [Elusimicrobia bacterium]|nr:mechanosensitive ion channel family protein [Elusimicrobiota bacterium]
MTETDGFSLIFTPGLRYFLPALFAFIAVLYIGARSSRRRLAAAGLVSAAAVAGLLMLAVMSRFKVGPEAALFRVFHGLSVLLLSIGAINACGVLAFDLLLPALRLGVPALVQDIIRAAAYICAALTVLSQAGANLTGILATSAMVTAVVAFSLQDTLGNVIGGMVIQFESSFEPGDWIRVGNDEGLVREIRWRQTTLDTGGGNIIVIPNSALMKGTVTVVGRGGSGERRRLMRVPFNVYYDRAPSEVIDAVEGALREDPPPGVASDPPPWCVVSELKEGYAVYGARYWLSNLPSPEATDSEVRTRIYYALSRVGIKLSIPAHAVVVLQKDEDVQERSCRLEAERRLAALRGVDIFQSLNAEELGVLSERLKASPFTRGEMITRQGARADWLYILVRGEAEVRLYSEDGAAFQTVGRLGSRDFLGEMGLMTGEPRSATVLALCDVLCYRLDRESFTDVLARRPEIAESISLVLARRKIELAGARGGLDEKVRRQGLSTEQGDLLSRIRSFFALD